MKKHRQDPNAMTMMIAKYVVVFTASNPPFCTLIAKAMMDPMRVLPEGASSQRLGSQIEGTLTRLGKSG